jgi:hypothetical protein
MYRNRAGKEMGIDMQRREQRLRDAEMRMTGRWDDVVSIDEFKANHKERTLGTKVKDLEKRWPC